MSLTHETGNLAIFLQDRNRVYGTLYDRSENKIAEVDVSDLSNKFQSFIGHQIDGKKICLFMKTTNGRSYGRLVYDFEKKTSFNQEFDFKLKREKYINATSRRDKMFLFSIPKHSSTINVYVFGEDAKPKLHALNFKDFEFNDEHKQPKNLYDLLKETKGFGYSSEINAGQVEENVPNPIETTSKQLKFYNKGEEVILSLDQNPQFTYLIHINLKSFEKKVDKIEKPQLENTSLKLNTNSFMDNGKLFQITSNSDAIKVQVIDLNNENKVLKTFSLKDDEDITFKNTPIIQEGGMYDSYREMEKTSKFLRKMRNADVGVSFYEQNGRYELTLGSAKKILRGGGMTMYGAGFAGGLVGGAIAVSFNPMWGAYSGYITTKSVRITGLFDKNWNHLIGDVPQNPFDKIKEFADNQDHITAETIFQKDGSFYWGAYNKKNDQYHIYKF